MLKITHYLLCGELTCGLLGSIPGGSVTIMVLHIRTWRWHRNMLCVNDSEVAGKEHSSGAVKKDLVVLFAHTFCRHSHGGGWFTIASGNEKRPLRGYWLRCSFNIALITLSDICLSVAVSRAVILPIPWYGDNVSHPEIACIDRMSSTILMHPSAEASMSIKDLSFWGDVMKIEIMIWSVG